MRKDGFIFLELLLTLAITAIAMSLFWQSSNNRIRMLSVLEEKYAFGRLTADTKIFRNSNIPITIEPSHYLPLKVELSSPEVITVSDTFENKVILE
jgi:hypothetical protein